MHRWCNSYFWAMFSNTVSEKFLSNVCKYCFGEYIFRCLEINLSEISGKIPASTGKNQHLEKPRKFWKCQDFQQWEIGYICNTFLRLELRCSTCKYPCGLSSFLGRFDLHLLVHMGQLGISHIYIYAMNCSHKMLRDIQSNIVIYWFFIFWKIWRFGITNSLVLTCPYS